MIKKLLVIVCLLGLVTVFYLYGGHNYLNIDSFKLYKEELLTYTAAHYWQAYFIAGAIYIISTALSLPGASILSLSVGFIFGRWYGVLLTTVSATIGAVLVFWIVRYLIADWARERLEKVSATKKVMENLKTDSFGYLIFMRTIPLFPFWFVNMIFAFSPIKTKSYAFGTLVGILPASFVIVNLGKSLSTVNSLDEIFTGEVLISFALIGLLGLITGIISIRKRRAQENTN